MGREADRGDAERLLARSGELWWHTRYSSRTRLLSSLIDPLIYRFFNFELDDSELQLRRDGDLVAVEPRVLALIIRLVK